MDSLGLLASADEAALRARMTQEPYATLWRRLVSRWEEMAAREDVRRGDFRQGNLGWPGVTPRIVDAALIHRLAGRADALAYVAENLDRVIERYADVHSPEELKKWRWRDWGPFVLSHSEMALAGDIVRDALPAATRANLARTMRESIIGFADFDATLAGYGSGGNIPCCKSITAGIAALVWGAESGYPDWETVVWKAAETVRQYIRHGCDASGFCYEGTGYGHAMFAYVYLYAQLLVQRGVRDLFAEEPVLERIPDASQHMLLDDHSFAATTNDHGLFEPWSMWWLPLTAKRYNRPDHLGLWHAFQGPDHPVRPYGDIWPWFANLRGTAANHTLEEKPDPSLYSAFLWWDADAPVRTIDRSALPTAQCAEGTGTATFRTSWSPGGVFAALLGGGRSHTCFGHAHLDCGHFDISAFGQYLAIDTGRYNFPEDQHSVVFVEGHERCRDYVPGRGMSCDMTGGRLCDFQSHAMVDYCRADAAQMRNCAWADRHFLFVKTPDQAAYIVLLDNMRTGAGEPRRFIWQMQAHPEAEIAITGERDAVVRKGGARLDVSFFMKDNLFAPGAAETFSLAQGPQEWIWPYGRDQDVTQMERIGILFTSIRRPRLVAVQTAVSCALGAVISPRRQGEPPRRVTVADRGNLQCVTVTDGLFSDTILIALDHAYIDTPEYYGLCELAIVRRDAGGNVVDVWSKDGRPLTAKGAAARRAGGA